MENLTADQLVAFFQGEGLLATVMNLLIFLAGIITNIYNQIKREDISLKEYWMNYGKRSIASISTLTATFFGMLFMVDVPMFAYYTTGLATDYLVNKAPKKEEL